MRWLGNSTGIKAEWITSISILFRMKDSLLLIIHSIQTLNAGKRIKEIQWMKIHKEREV